MNVWEQLGKVGISQACAPGSGSPLHFVSTAAAPLPPRASPAFESTSRRKPAIPQTATRWCHKLTTGLLPAPSRRNAEQTRCPKRQLSDPPPQASSAHLRCDSGPSRVTLRALFSPLWQVLWFGSYLLLLSISLSLCLSLFIFQHPPPSVSLPLCLPQSLLSSYLYLCSVFILLSKPNAASSYTSPLKKKKNLMCVYLFGCAGS